MTRKQMSGFESSAC